MSDPTSFVVLERRVKLRLGKTPMQNRAQIPVPRYSSRKSNADTLQKRPDREPMARALAFNDEFVDAYAGQTNHRLTASRMSDGVQVGYIDYAIYRGKSWVSMIEVADGNMRQGVATWMLRALQALNPENSIGWGMTTPEGSALKAAVTYTVANARYQRLTEALWQVRTRMAERRRLAGVLLCEPAFSPGGQAEEAAFDDDWNHLHDWAYDLEQALRDVEPTHCRVRLDDDAAPVIDRARQTLRWVDSHGVDVLATQAKVS